MTDTNRRIFSLGGMEVSPGEKRNGWISLSDGTIQMPVTILHGKKAGKTVLITAGIHAGEYVGIQTAIELGEKLKIEKVSGTIVIVKVVNRPAFEVRNGSMGLEDGKNLNRVFPGKPDGTEMERLAFAVAEELQVIADYYIDLHSGDDYENLTPYVYYAGIAADDVVKVSRQMAEQTDVPYMVRSNVSSGGAYNHAASRGIPSILIERGGMGAWSTEEVQSTIKDVCNVLRFLNLYSGERDYRTYYPLDVTDVCYQDALHGGCWYPFKKPGDIIQKGDMLGEVRDYEGNIKEICMAEADGVILYQTETLQVLEDGPMIAYGCIRPRSDERKKHIIKYWEKRSESFLEQRSAELHDSIAQRWIDEIAAFLPENKTLNILDVGCGAGFFSILLAKQGHKVSGIDLTPQMIRNAAILAEQEQVSCEFQVMDAEKLNFPDASFDVVVSRNLTWTLPYPEHAYAEWMRVLKPGGLLLNFDANYGLNDTTDKSDLPVTHAHHLLGDDMLKECEEIKRQLPVSFRSRPAWDIEVLGQLRIESCSVDFEIGRRIYVKKDEFYNPVPLFLIFAKKSSVKRDKANHNEV